MSKWMVRLWGWVALAALAALFLSSAWQLGPAGISEHEKPPPPRSEAPPPTAHRYRQVTPNESIARDALLGFTRSGNEQQAAQVLERAHQRLRKAASAEPNDPCAADVLLARGLNPGEVEELLTRHALKFASVEAKTPVSDGSVMTFWITQYGPPPYIPGSIAEQVERSLGRQRLLFLRRSQSAGNTEEGRRAREIATSHELGAYRVEVWGQQRSLLALLEEPDVRGVIADVDSRRADSYEQLYREMQAQIVIRGPTMRVRIPEDPNEPLPPLPPDFLEMSSPGDTAIAGDEHLMD